jgi:hypothetical protein
MRPHKTAVQIRGEPPQDHRTKPHKAHHRQPHISVARNRTDPPQETARIHCKKPHCSTAPDRTGPLREPAQDHYIKLHMPIAPNRTSPPCQIAQVRHVKSHKSAMSNRTSPPCQIAQTRRCGPHDPCHILRSHFLSSDVIGPRPGSCDPAAIVGTFVIGSQDHKHRLEYLALGHEIHIRPVRNCRLSLVNTWTTCTQTLGAKHTCIRAEPSEHPSVWNPSSRSLHVENRRSHGVQYVRCVRPDDARFVVRHNVCNACHPRATHSDTHARSFDASSQK